MPQSSLTINTIKASTSRRVGKLLISEINLGAPRKSTQGGSGLSGSQSKHEERSKVLSGGERQINQSTKNSKQVDPMLAKRYNLRMGSFTKTKMKPSNIAAGGGTLGPGEKIKLNRDQKCHLNTSSCFNSRDYLTSMVQAGLDSANHSTAKVKRNLNSISLMNNIPLLKLMQSKPKKGGELKIKSVSRSFSRRRTNQASATVETTSTNITQLGSGTRHQKTNSGVRASTLYNKIRAKEHNNYFGLKSPPTRQYSPSQPMELEQNKGLIELKLMYQNKEFNKMIEVGEELIKSDKNLQADPNVHFMLAMSYYKLEKYAEAKLHFQAVLALNERYKKSVYVFLAICHSNLKELEEAQAVLNRACAFYPKFYEARVRFDLSLGIQRQNLC